MVYKYIIYGCELESDIEFPQLVKPEQEAADIAEQEAGDITEHVTGYETEDITEQKADNCIEHKTENKNTDSPVRIAESHSIPEYITNRDKSRKYFFGDKLSFLENKTLIMWVTDAESIFFVRKPDANENYIRAYLLGFGLSMLFMQRGKLMLHCSAVRKGDKAVLICGESGCGKSTVTTQLLAKGYNLMADDVALLDKCGESTVVYPAFPYQKLCRDAALKTGYDIESLLYIDEDKDKFLVPYEGQFDVSSAAAEALIILGWNDDENEENKEENEEEKVICEEITGLHKISGIAENLFLRKLLGADKYKPQIGSLCLKYGAGIPMLYISRNKKVCLPEDVVSVIERFIK